MFICISPKLRNTTCKHETSSYDAPNQDLWCISAYQTCTFSVSLSIIVSTEAASAEDL